MSLLRFVDPSTGTIFIDGIDITTIGLKDLRSRVVSTPQSESILAYIQVDYHSTRLCSFLWNSQACFSN